MAVTIIKIVSSSLKKCAFDFYKSEIGLFLKKHTLISFLRLIIIRILDLINRYLTSHYTIEKIF